MIKESVKQGPYIVRLLIEQVVKHSFPGIDNIKQCSNQQEYTFHSLQIRLVWGTDDPTQACIEAVCNLSKPLAHHKFQPPAIPVTTVTGKKHDKNPKWLSSVRVISYPD